MAVIFPVLNQLRDCLCFALEGTSSGAVCSCCVIHSGVSPASPGADSIFADSCKCGIAWVRLVEMIPRVQRDGQAPVKRRMDGQVCVSADGKTATIEVGVLRCVPAPTSQAQLCSCLDAHAEAADEDLEAMLQAIECCELQATVRRILPAGRGDCAGTTVLIEIPIDHCSDCGSPGESP